MGSRTRALVKVAFFHNTHRYTLARGVGQRAPHHAPPHRHPRRENVPLAALGLRRARLPRPPRDIQTLPTPLCLGLRWLLFLERERGAKWSQSRVRDARQVVLGVWHNAPLWKGFMMCCTMLTDENSQNCFTAALVRSARVG